MKRDTCHRASVIPPSEAHGGIPTPSTWESAQPFGDEKLLILKTLEATNNNKTRAAEILGISLKTLHNKLKEYGSAEAE